MSGHRHAILLVEDHVDVRESYELVIEQSGFDVVSVRTGVEGLARLRADPSFCLILLDWWLPDLGGEQFRRAQLAEPRLACIPVAVITGDARAETEALALGCQHVFLKPADPEEIVGFLHKHCDERPAGPAPTVA